MKRLSRYMEKVVFVLMILLIASIFTNLQAQTAPTGGKKVLPVSEGKYENEYSFEVFKSFSKAPYDYHMKKLPKKLAKYGFTNVVITALGSVQPVPDKDGSVSLAVAYINSGASYDTAVSKLDPVSMSQFQVNFQSDQGFFKVRMTKTALGFRYIIKE